MSIVELERKEILDRIKSENDLIHQRMTWLGTFQGLLFAAVAFAWKEPSARSLIYVSSAVGLSTAVSIGYAIYRANKALNDASAHWEKLKPNNFQGLDVEGYRSGAGVAWLMPGAFVPKMFAFAWVAVYLIALIS